MSASDEVSEAAVKAVEKRYEGLLSVRAKAIKGKGAWYWSHLEPLLVHSTDTGLPKSVKLRCTLCDAVFSASNPSRTSSEHLKRGTCPNFNRPSSSAAKPISTVHPPPQINGIAAATTSPEPEMESPANPSPVPVPATATAHFGFSGAKRLKSPPESPSLLERARIESGFDLLADWVYECGGSVSLSSLENPKFVSFLRQVGMPAISRREIAGSRLDARYEASRVDSETRIAESMFFQIAADGWRRQKRQKNRISDSDSGSDNNLVNLTVNLPNGTTLYRRAVFVESEDVPSGFAEDVLTETISGICGDAVERCVGIVSDKFGSTALRSLEDRNRWMVNLSCQVRAFKKLLKDFAKELPLFNSVSQNCLKLAHFVNESTQIRNTFKKYQSDQSQELLHVPAKGQESNFYSIRKTIDQVFKSSRVLQPILEDYDSIGVWDIGFWGDLEAVVDLIKIVSSMAGEIELERPLVGQCLPIWDNLRTKVRNWASRFKIDGYDFVERLISRRFAKNYHPAWSAALILDPVYLIRGNSGKNYLPPIGYLSPEQEKDVDRLVTRMVSSEEAHIVLMELMKWRTEGLDPVYARAVQMKERDPSSGKMRLANPRGGRLVWETYLTDFRSLGKVAVRLMFLHATACCGVECDWGFRGGRAEKLVFLAAQARLERGVTASFVEDREGEGFGFENGMDEVLADTSSVGDFWPRQRLDVSDLTGDFVDDGNMNARRLNVSNLTSKRWDR